MPKAEGLGFRGLRVQAEGLGFRELRVQGFGLRSWRVPKAQVLPSVVRVRVRFIYTLSA